MPFQKGNQLGKIYSKGRPRNPEVEELRIAIKTVERQKKKKLLTHFVEKAYENPQVLIALGKKIVPDLSAIDNKHEITDELRDFFKWLSERD